ncbi:MAG TPA: NosD domain-containing protein [Candidatus Binatia bacterium]
MDFARVPLAAMAVATALPMVCATAAHAKDCGGAVACECGDRVVASVVLPQNLNNCSGDGLVVAAGVVDCQGHQIAGPGDRTDTVGVLIRGFNASGAQGAAVRNCRVRNFGRGIEIDGGSGNTVANNVVFSNEIGIWLGDATANNVVEDNHVRDNRDEGIHVGSGAHGNQVRRNTLVNNKTENLYVIGAHGNSLTDNVIDDSDTAAVLLKDSDDNELLRNDIRDRAVLVRGDSNGNVFGDNVLGAGYYHFQAFKGDNGWGYPHDNHVVGGSIIKASTCFELNGAYANTFTGVLVDSCRIREEKELGGLVPHDNVFDVTRTDLGEPEYHGQRRAGSIRRIGNPSRLDRLRLDVRGIDLPSDLPNGVSIGCTLTDFQGQVFSFTVPTGILRVDNRGVNFVDGTGTFGGVQRLRFARSGPNRWRLKLAARVDLSKADHPLMTLACQVGASSFSFTDFWIEHRRGWNLRAS